MDAQVELAFAEARAQINKYLIDLQAKPDWYAPKVNPASKVRHPVLPPPLLVAHIALRFPQ